MLSNSASAQDPGRTPAAVLARARADQKAAREHEVRVLEDALEWGGLHTVDPAMVDHVQVATWRGTELAIAGAGAPLVEEFCVAELATALRMSHDAGRRLLAHALELGHRLPRLWSRVQAGGVEPWKARRVADLTLGLTAEAAAWVDAHVADFAHTLSLAALERLVDEAVARFMPAEAAKRRQAAFDGRHLDIHTDQLSFTGTSRIEGSLDLADALDLEAAIAQGARSLADLGSTESLDVRRARAAGELARRQLAFGFDTGEDNTADPAQTQAADPAQTQGQGAARSRTKPGRQVVLYVHLHQSAITGTGTGGQGVDIARVENRGPHLVTADTIREWLGVDGTKVTVRPVIDLNDETAVDSYEIPDRIREAVILRDKTCYFPYCTRPARACDLDHIVPFAQGGKTSTANLAPGCRRDHRHKTHGDWRVRVIRPGTYEWTSPHGHRYLVWPGGTIDLNPDPPQARPGGLQPTGTDPP
jgi:hypothetical protein